MEMTRRDVIIQILSEVSGKPREFVQAVVGVVPLSKAMDDELPNGEGEKLLEQIATGKEWNPELVNRGPTESHS